MVEPMILNTRKPIEGEEGKEELWVEGYAHIQRPVCLRWMATNTKRISATLARRMDGCVFNIITPPRWREQAAHWL